MTKDEAATPTVSMEALMDQSIIEKFEVRAMEIFDVLYS